MGTSHPQAVPQPLWGGGEWKQTDSGSKLGQLIGQTPVFSKARHSIRSSGINRNENFAVHCTFHVKVEEILEKVLKVPMFELTETTSPIRESFI